jgi:hypothetical protein
MGSRTAYNREWRRTHPELVKKQNERCYAKNSEKRRAYARQYAKEHPEKIRSGMKKWREENKEYRKKYDAEWYEKNREQQRAYQKARTRAIRLEVLTHYGKFCHCCGEEDWEFLTIDHIEGGGTSHREELNIHGTKFYYWLKKHNFPSGYRTLCFNCNCAMGTLGYCPHQIGAEKFETEMKLAALAKGIKK